MHKPIGVILFLMISCSAFGQLEVDTVINGVSYYKKRHYSLTPTNFEPKIDGKLNDECWKEGKWESNFVQYSPAEGAAASQITSFKIKYDFKNVYIGAKCYDNEPDKMQPLFNSRDVFSGDMVGFAFDSYFDKKSAYEFVMTSAGQKIDLKHIGDYKWDLNWNAVWDGAVSVSDSGCTCEMKIPLSQLRYIDKPEQTWGMLVWRLIRRNSEESHWQLIPRNSPAIVDQFGIIDGITNIKQPRQVEISPYASVKFTPENKLTRIPDQTYKPMQSGYGVDAKIGIASNLVLDLTVNPDFGQIETDPSELNLTSYETFFDEKRPFFLESRDLFDFDIAEAQMFYSRRIGQSMLYNPALLPGESINIPKQSAILGAAKLTGKTSNGLSIGIIESVINKEIASISSPDTAFSRTVNPYTNYFVGRIKKEYNNAQTIVGGMITGTNKFITDNYLGQQLSRNSYSGGLDFVQYFKRKTYYVEGKAIVSSINGTEQGITFIGNQNVHRFQRPDASYLQHDSATTFLTGTGGEMKIGKQGGKWRYSLAGSWLSPNLDINDAGYIRQSDLINQGTALSYVITKPKGILLNYSVLLNQDASWSFGNELINSRIKVTFNSKFKNFWVFNTNLSRNTAYLDPRILRGGPALANIPYWTYFVSPGTSSAKNLSVSITYQFRYNEDNLYSFSQFSANIKWLLLSRIRLVGNISYTQNKIEQQYITGKTIQNGDLFLFGSLNQNILQFIFRAAVFITPEFSLEYYGNPYLSIGDYSKFKKVNDSHSQDINQRFTQYKENEISYSESDSKYHVYDQLIGSYDFRNPDFNFAEFRSNLVFKWEYKLGSVLYFVWSHNRTYDQKISSMSQSDNFDNLWKVPAKNVFMVKLNYWFGI